MYLRLRGSNVPEPLVKALAAATDHADVSPREVHHAPETRMLRLAIRRAPASSRRFLPGYVYDRTRLIPATITIRNVAACRVHSDPECGGATLQLLFGLKVDGEHVYASSAAEHHGAPCFQLEATVSELDIELTDVGEMSPLDQSGDG